jgi:hypothetical protein
MEHTGRIERQGGAALTVPATLSDDGITASLETSATPRVTGPIERARRDPAE